MLNPLFVGIVAMVLLCCGAFIVALLVRRRGRSDLMFFFVGVGMAGITGLLFTYSAQLKVDPAALSQSTPREYSPSLAEFADVMVLIPAVIACIMLYYGIRLLHGRYSARVTQR